jgi:methionyl-tRNA formyltransferase
MKLVFCGTPAFAVPTLKAVIAAGQQVALVVTQPDRAVGRNAVLTPPAVKVAALEHGLPVVQPEKIKNNLELRAQLESIKPDAILIVAYGRIIPKWMLDLPRFGNLNLHGSLLPKYRGAAPIQWAIANGETVTGVTTMRIDEGLDTGDMLLQRSLDIPPDATSEDMYPLLAELGAGLMVKTLSGLVSGTLTAQKQDHAHATLAPILQREDALVDFTNTAQHIYNRWRGFQPWPGAYTFLSGKKLSLLNLRPTSDDAKVGKPGDLMLQDGRCLVACGDQSSLELFDVQIEGKKRLSIAEFLRGAGLKTGDRLG